MSVFGDKIQSDGLKVEGDEESDIEGVPDTIFGDNFDLPKGGHEEVVNQASEDPFHIYDLLNKKPNDTGHVASPSMSHPPGFTPVDSEVREEVRNDEAIPDTGIAKEASPVINSKVMFNSQEVREASFGDSAAQNIGNQHKGGSIMVVLEDMIRVGHSMGYNLEGCMKDIETSWSQDQKSSRELNFIHKVNFLALQETKMDRISHMDVKSMWGNSNFDFDLSESVGNSGAVYAPQETSSKRLLWEYLAILLRRWNGEAIIMGDFNAVRSKEERLGYVFNRSCARLFDKFISSSGLVDINLEGYTFTWSHPSASKMSRCGSNTDFGPTPFRFYHSWFSFDGFDKMVEDAWLSFSHSDSNRLVRFKKKLQALKSIIRQWVKDKRLKLYNVKSSILKNELSILIGLGYGNALWERYPAQAMSSDSFPARISYLQNNFRQGHHAGMDVTLPFIDLDPRAMVILDLVSETQSAFDANRQILDGPFILNEMFFMLSGSGLIGEWSRGSLGFAKASILVNGSPTSEFSFHCGLKQGDPLAPFLFILIMESLHFSFSRAVNDGLFKGLQLQGSVNISHLFYADDAMFIGEWSDSNLRGITSILKCFSLASGLNINIQKSQVMGVCWGFVLFCRACCWLIGCSVMNNSFRYLGVKVGECMSRKVAWDDTSHKFMSRLSKWKVKTLSIGGRLTLIKSVLGASPLYNMSIFKVPKGVLKILEAARCNFFNGADPLDRKITWVAWNKVLASKRKAVIQALYGSKLEMHSLNQPSIWCSIIREVRLLKDKGFDFMSHCKKRVGDGRCTLFWEDLWITDVPLRAPPRASDRYCPHLRLWERRLLVFAILTPSKFPRPTSLSFPIGQDTP
ncbi:RNA-directed DNA polymerase, eukaryota [Tanacetum coccineum]|uniref:RNA-directed DNA polymerase, eukaryota n=1 Tax=Tanacetum coccineum TaxID=301880 RepID=A0ABQ5HMA8_9ASTR